MRTLIITGNGLGRSVDNEWFDLRSAIRRVWEDSSLMDEPTKRTIQHCIPQTGISLFEGEHDLDLLHRARVSCDSLKNIVPFENPWLTDDGISFPDRTAHFITKIASTFQNTGRSLPNSFIDPLAEFLRETNSHIATLNYDDLLYIPLIDRGILQGFETLVDGFWVKQGGFAESNMIRMNGKNFGYYLHLHGSPLFVGNNKIPHSQVGSKTSHHIVLTHIRHKREVISASDILSTYWSYLGFALAEIDRITIVGYSGLDYHLNGLISRYAKRSPIPIKIIERKGEGSLSDRSSFWKKTFRVDQIEIVQFDNILEFNGW